MSNGEPLSLDAAMALEIAVWTALKAGDAAADAAALAPDFLGVYPSGFASRADHVEQLDAGPSIAEFALSALRLDLIAPDAALLTYRACFARAATPEHREIMYVSSLWRRRDGRWINTFSQDTPAAAD